MNAGDDDWLAQPCRSPCKTSRERARKHQQQLTKPPGSLGQLEDLAIQLAGLQATDTPAIRPAISIFAADHGIATEGVSAFPQSVTAEMVRNFASGGAAIAILARHQGADLRVCNLGTINELESIPGVENKRLGPGTENFHHRPAMTNSQLTQALAIGKQHVEDARETGCTVFIAGEMGIANTSSATALACALLQQPVELLIGTGTGVDSNTLQRKQAVIATALARHMLDRGDIPDPIHCLRTLGGFEIAAITGCYLRGAQLGIPLLVDGFIASVAALLACRINPEVHPWLLLGHLSAEAGHQRIVEALALSPLLQLNLRLGEASGAASALPLLNLACALHNEMATFAGAAVSTQLEP